MPRGKPNNWTREQLERIENFTGKEQAESLSKEFGCTENTLYSIKLRIKNDGIDEILATQDRRIAGNRVYRSGGAGSALDTLSEQLKRVHNITCAQGGRGGQSIQYTLTVPHLLGSAWVEKYGKQVRFVPTDEGILIVPVEVQAPEIPAWLKDERGRG